MEEVDRQLLFAVEDGVATITLNRPDRRYAFTDAMVSRWVERLEECERAADVRVIVITAAGDSFSSGGDVAGLGDKALQTPLDARARMVDGTQALVRRIASMEKPVIAAVNGTAVGGGMDVALLCDVRLASSTARFSETCARMGLVPGVGGAFTLPRLIGASRALDLFWTARWVDATEALALGIVDRVFPDEEFREAVAGYARQVAGMAPLAVATIKRLVRQSHSSDLPAHLDALASHIALIRTSDDHREALAAFREKRAPIFNGR